MTITPALTLIGRTHDDVHGARYWYFTREHRILARPQWISRENMPNLLRRMRYVGQGGCVKFYEWS